MKKVKLSGFNQMTFETIQSLSLLYAPIVSNEAITLYLLYVSLSSETIVDEALLMEMMGRSKNEIERLRQLLEQYQLLRTYIDEEGMYYIDIQKPIDGRNFSSHMLYSRVLFSKLDQTTYQRITNCFKDTHYLSHLKEISAVIDLSDDLERLEKEEQQFQEVLEFGIEHQFDYSKFIQLCEPLMIPKSFVENKHILHKIGEYASIYNIDVNNMAKYVAKSTVLSNQTLDFQKLVNYISNAKIRMEEKEGVIHPLTFIQQKQNGVPPLKADRKLVEKLFTEYRLSKECINLLIEHSLNKNNQRIQANYIEKIAASWIIKNIKTLEEAKATLVSKTTKKPSRKDLMVASWEKPVEKMDVEIDIDELLEWES